MLSFQPVSLFKDKFVAAPVIARSGQLSSPSVPAGTGRELESKS